MAGAEVTRVTPRGPDTFELQVNAQRDDGQMQLGRRLQFHQAEDGWRWVVTPEAFEEARRGWGELMRGRGK
jgi:hypothetical protein